MDSEVAVARGQVPGTYHVARGSRGDCPLRSSRPSSRSALSHRRTVGRDALTPDAISPVPNGPVLRKSATISSEPWGSLSMTSLELADVASSLTMTLVEV